MIVKINKFFIVILIALAIFACHKDIENKKLKLHLVNKFKMIDIYSPELCATKDKIFVTNSYKSTDGKIYVYDYNGNLLKTFGSKGKGPGEFELIVQLFYNPFKNNLGVYDFYNMKIQYFDENYKLIHSDAGILIFSISSKIGKQIRFYKIPKITDNKNFYYTVELIEPDGIKKIIKEKREKNISKSILNDAILTDTNEKNIFIYDFDNDVSYIEKYDKKGNLSEKWKKLEHKNIKRYEKILVGKDFLLLSLIDTNDKHFYDVYDLSQNYLGRINMENEDDKIAYVYEKYIFWLKENKGDDSYECEIYEL